MINFCSNDYLGLSQHKDVLSSARRICQVSPCSSRLLGGNHESFDQLEGLLAKHRKSEAALVYPTGYGACVGAITALADTGATIYSDELNHASIIDGCRLSGARIEVFRHNDYETLRKVIKRRTGRKIIVTEGLFSMDGDSADLRSMVEVADAHGALTIVDDAHGDFVRGPSYSGTPAQEGVPVDVHISSLSKALGCFGGYVASSAIIRELLINSSRQFIYTSALPASLCDAACTAIGIAKRGTRQARLQKNIQALSSALGRIGIELVEPSQIAPIPIGDERKATKFARALFEQGVFAQAIRYPTVAKGKARLRLSLTALHNLSHISKASSAIRRAAELARKD